MIIFRYIPAAKGLAVALLGCAAPDTNPSSDVKVVKSQIITRRVDECFGVTHTARHTVECTHSKSTAATMELMSAKPKHTARTHTHTQGRAGGRMEGWTTQRPHE